MMQAALNCGMTIASSLSLLVMERYFDSMDFDAKPPPPFYLPVCPRGQKRKRNNLFIHVLRFKVCNELVILLMAGMFEKKEKKDRRRMEVVYEFTGLLSFSASCYLFSVDQFIPAGGAHCKRSSSL